MKTCTVCKISKETSCFAKKRNGLSPKCKSCQNEYSKAWYLKNRKKRIKQVKDRKELIYWMVEPLNNTTFCVLHYPEFKSLMSLARTGFGIQYIKESVEHLSQVKNCFECNLLQFNSQKNKGT